MHDPDDHDLSFTTQLVTDPDRTQTLLVRRARLEVLEGPERGASVDVRHPGLVVGATQGCGLILTDPAVSRRHFEITPTDQGFRLRDLGSKNGTRIGGVLVGEVILPHGAELLVGKTRLMLSLAEGHDAYPVSTREELGSLIGQSMAMRRTFALLEHAARSDATLLIEGESGTGKELAAKGVHQLSDRAAGPLVVVDCAGVQAGLIESELFGHRRGAFTGAEHDRAGAFEAARGGTLFIDEVGELTPALQPKLLRVIESREVKRLGENHHRPVDVRIVAATNRDLDAEVAAGRFREDLFFRLSVLSVRMPALRERREDIPLLARHLASKIAPDVDPAQIVEERALGMLMSHEWPGNVRELRNVVERLVLFPGSPLAAGQSVDGAASDVPGELLGLPYREARDLWLGRFDRAYLLAQMDASSGVVARAAERAGMPRQSFHRLMKKRGLSR